MKLSVQTRLYWEAAHFFRRSGKSDLTIAKKFLEKVAADAPARLKDRAINVLVEIDNEQFNRACNR